MTRRNARLALFVFTSLLVLAGGVLLVGKVMSLHRLGVLGITYQDHIDTKAAERIREKIPALAMLLRSGQVMMVMNDGPAERAGIEPGDQMISFGGVPISDSKGLKALAARLRPGDAILVRWQTSEGAPRAAEIELESPVRNSSLFLSPGTSLIVALAYFLIGTLVLRARKEDRGAQVFHLLTAIGAGFFLASALYEVHVHSPRGIESNSVGIESGMGLALVAYGIFAFALTAALVHFALVFPRPRAFVERYPRIIAAVYSAPVIVLVCMFTGLGMMTVRKGVAPAVLTVSLALASGAILTLTWRKGGGGLPALLSRPVLSLAAICIGIIAVLQLARFAPAYVYPIVVAGLFGLAIAGISFGYPVLALVLFVNSYRRSGLEERRQFRWPLFGLISALGGVVLLSVVMMILGLTTGYFSDGAPTYAMQLSIQGLSKFLYLIIPVSFAFGILKYRLMEVDLVIRKTLVYSIVSAVVLLFYLLLVGGIGTLLVRTTHSRSDVVVIGATLLVALAFIPLRNRVQALVDRTFFRNRASLPLLLRELGVQLSGTDDVATILSVTAEKLQRGMQLRHVRILSGKVAAMSSSEASGIAGGGDFAGVFEDRSFTIARSPAAPAGLPLSDVMRELLAKHAVARIVAPAADRGVVAVILAGEKLSGEEWDLEDDEFLVSVAERMALSIETARLRSEEEEFRQAQQIQRSLLPRELPQIEGITVSGFWQPARAVGGDYYDCLRFDDRRLAVCIGDVVGKGMPAALLMSSLQAGVRAVADAATPPSTVLERVRRVVENTLDRGKFITFFYGILDSETKEFRYANAGHNPPILVRSDGTVEWLEKGGPAFARLFRTQPFVVATASLMAGDRIVLFTDGLTEAEDEAGNPFGDDRLLDLILESRGLPARELQEALLTAVLRYSNGNLHDDLTMLVIEVS